MAKDGSLATGFGFRGCEEQRIRLTDLRPAVKAIYDRAPKHAYEDQQKVLKKAEGLK